MTIEAEGRELLATSDHHDFEAIATASAGDGIPRPPVPSCAPPRLPRGHDGPLAAVAAEIDQQEAARAGAVHGAGRQALECILECIEVVRS